MGKPTLRHLLFHCPTFWRVRPYYRDKHSCPECGKKYRCYYQGNDVIGHGIDLCNKCAKKYEKEIVK